MKHKIKYNDLLTWMKKQRRLYTSDNGRKRFYCTFYGVYEVEKEGRVILKTSEIEEAVETYNDL